MLVHTKEELGADPRELPSPLLAGAASLAAFSLGALIPLLPYLAGAPYLALALGITAAALAAGGMAVGRVTGRPLFRSGLRQLALGGIRRRGDLRRRNPDRRRRPPSTAARP
ncbi:MAG: VIT1/CCC1 transporter family protein [Trebonia sp.]